MEDPKVHLAELESRLAFQEDAIATINQELATHVQRIHDLETQLRHLHRKLVELGAAADSQAHGQDLEPPPPHY